MRGIVQQRFVHGAELLHAKVPVRNAFAPVPGRRRARRYGNDGAAGGRIVQAAAFRERRPGWREQPAVERRHGEIASSATGVRQPRGGAHPVPQADAVPAQRCVTERFNAIALAVDGVPQRHKPACLGEQEKEEAVDNRQ